MYMVSNTTQWSTLCIDNIATTDPRKKDEKEEKLRKKGLKKAGDVKP